ncbi:MAG: hypothetical protein HY287_16225 [Planctomycetes bacterium]|nr:hypothetical protein [Planctomycetota bacterium]MBI3835873.1 hypothetical protein [Planctomycetota bacterium]
MVATSAVSVALILVWLAFRSEPEPPPVSRTLADVELTWRCEAGHVVKAAIPNGLPRCPNCGRPMAAILSFECPKHGQLEAEAQYELDASGAPRVSRFRLDGGDWVKAGDSLTCPKCGAVLKRTSDPLQKILNEKKKNVDHKPPPPNDG